MDIEMALKWSAYLVQYSRGARIPGSLDSEILRAWSQVFFSKLWWLEALLNVFKDWYG